jgi:formylglycine-generating enzyme required for sulfatase activity
MLDERLSFEDQQDVQLHVDGCPACQLRLDSMVTVEVDALLPLRELSVDSLRATTGPAEAMPDQRALLPSDLVTPQSPPSEPTSPKPSFAFLEPSDPLCLGRLAHYDMLEVIGSGGMGIVFKARDIRLQRIVAIKTLAPELATCGTARQRFLREARAAAAVSHDHIITIYAVEQGPVPYLVMELIDGQSLQQKIEQSGPLELLEILRIGYQIAAGLAAAHDLGLTHRDIKPANILLQNGIQRVRITDFGLARVADDGGITRIGEVVGSPQYMSPEQAQGHSVDARSDLFSLGCVLYAMAAGRSPFRAESAVAVLRRVCDESPLPIREINPAIPTWLAAIIDRLLAKDPNQRYQTAAEVAKLMSAQLVKSQQSRPEPDAADSDLPEAPLRPAQRRGWWKWAGLLTLFVAGLFAFTEGIGLTHLRRFVARETAVAGRDLAPVRDPSNVHPWPADAPPPATVPFDKDQAAAHQQAWADYLGVPVEFTNTLGMKLRLIPPGEFTMGSFPAETADALAIGGSPAYLASVKSETPPHKVQLSQPWYMGIHEVTQEHYQLVSGENPSNFSSQRSQPELADMERRSLPVEMVSWNECAQFCNALSRREGLPENYSCEGETCTVLPNTGYHLPTEAQWEFACRAGTTTRFWFAATGEQFSSCAWHKGNAESRTHAVGQLRPNPFGLHDVSGNVSEWCQDGYQPAYYAQFEQQTAVDPMGPSSDFLYRVVRGGSFRFPLLANRSAKRNRGGANFRVDEFGLRLAISVAGAKTILQAQREQPPAPAGPVPRAQPP